MFHCAIDLGFVSKQSVGVMYDPEQPRARSHVIRFRTTREEVTAQAQHHGWSTVIIEQCPPAQWVRPLLEGLGITVLVANTNDQTFRDAKQRAKTDRKDAERLRDLFLLGKLRTVQPLSARAECLRGLLDQRKRLVGSATASKNAIRALCETQGIALASGWNRSTRDQLESITTPRDDDTPEMVVWRRRMAIERAVLADLTHHISTLTKQITALEADDELTQQLRGVPGCGELVAPTIRAALDDPHRFTRAKQVSAYSGLAPGIHESGGSRRRRGITRQGWNTLRAYLIEAVHCGLYKLKDPWILLQYQRLLPRCGRPKKALVAVARRYFVRCWRMLRAQCTWQELNQADGLGA